MHIAPCKVNRSQCLRGSERNPPIFPCSPMRTYRSEATNSVKLSITDQSWLEIAEIRTDSGFLDELRWKSISSKNWQPILTGKRNSLILTESLFPLARNFNAECWKLCFKLGETDSMFPTGKSTKSETCIEDSFLALGPAGFTESSRLYLEW